MTFLIIHKYLKFINFIFTVIENYWDIRDGSVEILIFVFLPAFLSCSLWPGKQKAWKTDWLPFLLSLLQSQSPGPGKREGQGDHSTPFFPKSLYQGLKPDSTTDHLLQPHSFPTTTSCGSHSLSLLIFLTTLSSLAQAPPENLQTTPGRVTGILTIHLHVLSCSSRTNYPVSFPDSQGYSWP